MHTYNSSKKKKKQCILTLKVKGKKKKNIILYDHVNSISIKNSVQPIHSKKRTLSTPSIKEDNTHIYIDVYVLIS